MRIGWRSDVRPGGMAFLLAILALALQVVVPPGYMVGGGGADGPARIVICTGHGPVDAAFDLGGPKAPARGKHGEASCVFAGHAAPNTLAPPGPAIAAVWPRRAPLVVTLADQVCVGRGLAAPPPPARAPPFSLT